MFCLKITLLNSQVLQYLSHLGATVRIACVPEAERVAVIPAVPVKGSGHAQALPLQRSDGVIHALEAVDVIALARVLVLGVRGVQVSTEFTCHK